MWGCGFFSCQELHSNQPSLELLFHFQITPQEMNWEGIDSAEISGGKLGHWSCAKSLVHVQCASLDAEETVKASNKGRTNNGYALGAAEPRV